MKKLIRVIKYLWFFVITRIMWLLPDWVFIMRLRGFLLKPAFKSVGINFQVASTCMVIGSSEILIGNDVYFAHDSWIQGVGGINIGDEVMLGPQTIIVTTRHTMKSGSYRFGKGITAPVSIGRGAWTGAGVKVMPGVTIGAGVLCAAGAIITKDVAEYTVVAGVPAKVVSYTCTEE